MRNCIGRLAIGAVIVLTLVVGVSQLVAPAYARFKICTCPDVYAPVICSNGLTYSNGCVASCNGATGCHRTGDI